MKEDIKKRKHDIFMAAFRASGSESGVDAGIAALAEYDSRQKDEAVATDETAWLIEMDSEDGSGVAYLREGRETERQAYPKPWPVLYWTNAAHLGKKFANETNAKAYVLAMSLQRPDLSWWDDVRVAEHMWPDDSRPLDSEPVAPEDRAEQFIAAAIDRSPEPLRRLGEYLSNVLDDDHFVTAERMLLGIAETYTAPRGSAVREVTEIRPQHGDDAGDGLRYVLCKVGFGGHYANWLLIPHADGQYVTAAKLAPFSMEILRHALPEVSVAANPEDAGGSR